MDIDDSGLSRAHITPAGVTDWRLWQDGSRVWSHGPNAIACPLAGSPCRVNSQCIVRYTELNHKGTSVTVELHLDNPTTDCWELWRVVLDATGSETADAWPIAWCRWPSSAMKAAAHFLIKLHQQAFHENKVSVALASQQVLYDIVGADHLLR